jgi:antitoxin HicB
MKKTHVGSSLESLFEETGELEDVRALAAKKMIVDQYLAAMTERKLSVSALSRLMLTSRAAVKRLLDPKSTGVTLDSLDRAAAALGRDLRIELVPSVPSTVSKKNSSRRPPSRAPTRIRKSFKRAASR